MKIVLVHGAWENGSHRRHVIPSLHGEGYQVSAVQNPLTSLTDDIDQYQQTRRPAGWPGAPPPEICGGQSPCQK